ncbi:ribosome silencing factor [Pseudogracilibacillus sp. SO30301A]|uniref:ribosome silencing factor n=1 Tax=Pseudogracilibacillus sp. SO30301A TaxID=3098291 RepID=UPI00300E6B2E
MNVKQILQTVIEACEDRKAENCIALNMENLTPVADYFVICHGNNERQVQAIAHFIKESLEEKGLHVKRIEGFEHARWILIDVGDIICHIFHRDERAYYNLERLWGDAVEVSLGEQKD